MEVTWVEYSGDWAALYVDGDIEWQGHPGDYDAAMWLVFVQRMAGFHDGVEVTTEWCAIRGDAFREFEPRHNPRFPARLSDIGHGAFR